KAQTLSYLVDLGKTRVLLIVAGRLLGEIGLYILLGDVAVVPLAVGLGQSTTRTADVVDGILAIAAVDRLGVGLAVFGAFDRLVGALDVQALDLRVVPLVGAYHPRAARALPDREV